jgi:hypothetical protein
MTDYALPQPMATAPRDGTTITLVLRIGGPDARAAAYSAAWRDGDSTAASANAVRDVAEKASASASAVRDAAAEKGFWAIEPPSSWPPVEAPPCPPEHEIIGWIRRDGPATPWCGP